VALFLLTAAIPIRGHVVPIVIVGGVYVWLVVVVARRWGALYAVPLAIAGGLAFDSFYIPPTREFGAGDWQNWLVVAIYISMGVLIGMIGAVAQRRATGAEQARGRLAGEHAALRRVATLVARDLPPDQLFAAVAEEAGILLEVDGTRVVRYEEDEVVYLAGWSRPGEEPPGFHRVKLEDTSVSAEVHRTGRVARIDDYSDLPVKATFAQGTAVESVVGAPIVVESRVWGVMIAWSARQALPTDAEARLTDFTELVATAISNADARSDLGQLAEEQAALRRVATLVAEAVPAGELFAAVAREAGTLIGADLAGLARFEDDQVVTVATWAADGEHPPIPNRWQMQEGDPASVMAETRAAARWDDWTDAPGPIAAFIRDVAGVRSTVGCPIVVEGRLWGALAVHAKQHAPLVSGTEARLAQFSDLMGTAIANSEARVQVERLAQEQAALRRVATLVAEGGAPTAVFDAVAAEIEGLLNADAITVSRYEPAGEVIVLAHRGLDAWKVPPGTRVKHDGENVSTKVRRTERPARMESYEGAEGAIAELVESLGVRASVGTPIVVDGRLWGVTIANWRGEEPPPADTEERMAQFSQLLDSAIANADSRAQLTASRSRVLAAGDEARRRVVRDLHDGAQQRLVHTIVTLKLAERAHRMRDQRLESLLAEALAHAHQANAELRELAHGLLPSVLARGGLSAGVDALVSRVDLPARVDVTPARFAQAIEANAYFTVAEALTNVLKHSRAHSVEVTVVAADGVLKVEVRDDGIGGAKRDGTGLVGIDDRVTALGGRLRVKSPDGGGTLVSAVLPLVD
jgi:signal transduction histidine kinase